MDRIWAESQLDLLRWKAGNTTNFSTVSVTAQTEMGSTKVQSASNEQLLPFSLQSFQRGDSQQSQCTFSANAEECMDKLRARPVPIIFSSLFSCLSVSDAYCGNTHCSYVMKCALSSSQIPLLAGVCVLVVMEKQLAIIKVPLVGK